MITRERSSQSGLVGDPGFSQQSEYDRYVVWIGQQVAAGNLVEVPPDPDYKPDTLSGGRWYREEATGVTWRLLDPDYPFCGRWEMV